MNTVLDPWHITQREKVKYLVHFNALQPQNGYVTGGQAKVFFLQSQLPPLILGQIWALADTDSDGKMNINEFSIACKLINLKLRGVEIPKILPPSLLSSLNTVGSTPNITPSVSGNSSPLNAFKNLTNTVKLPNEMTNDTSASDGTLSSVASPSIISGPTVPSATVAVFPPAILNQTNIPSVHHLPGIVVPPVMTTVSSTPVVSTKPTMEAHSADVPAIETIGHTVLSNANIASSVTTSPIQSNPPSRKMSITDRAPSLESPQGEWIVKMKDKCKYTQVFNAADRNRMGFLTGVQARGILMQSKLPQATLAQIWTLSDLDCDGRLSCDEFILAMFLCDKVMNNEKIPALLPVDWIPPSYRKNKSRHSSVSGIGSRTSSQTASRHSSMSSQGVLDADPAAGLPQTTFEDKRKENFDKGQAELDRRRKLLQEQQRKEKEERERKEREEAEKKEKARLEAERKQQEELERQLQKQRELEMEKEEQRKRELEAKETARKELEKQRLLEWEQARIAELNSQKQREQERVLKQKAQNTQLNVELSTLNEKIKDLSQKICETRAGVTNVKSVIDGMRSERDSSMTEMGQLKTRIKEQNAKLLQLTQERAKWDAKIKATGPTDVAQQKQLNAAFANKQLAIKQLKDKVENMRSEIESKKEDIDSHNISVMEVKAELSSLINKCKELYAEYDEQRTKVLEMKCNKRNEDVSEVTTWETAASTVNTTDKYDNANIETIATVNTTDANEPAPEGFVKYRALFEFNARNVDEISFIPGDIIFVPLEQNAEPGWLAGEIKGHTGWFPETYVEKIVEVIPAQTYDSYKKQEYGTAIGSNAYNGEVEYYIAVYPYVSNEVGDLTFNAGEMIFVTKKEGDWWTGSIGSRNGMFPSNYVQKADMCSREEKSETSSKEKDIENENYNLEDTQQQKNEHQLINEMLPKQNVHENLTEKHAVEAAAAEETRSNEELDTEVSQINTQSNQKTQSNTESESYSRPMSRTSNMTPGMRAKRSEIAQVIAPYEATGSEQLSLIRGQLIMIRKKTDLGWWEGELQAKGRRRQIGWFPATYVKVLQGGRNSGRNTPVSGSRVDMCEQILDKVIALYPYKAQNDDELTFDKDDIISVLGRDEPEWWRGELNGLTGLFPSNYVGPFVTSGNV